MVPIMISLMAGFAKKVSTEARVPSGYVEVITVSIMTWLTVTEYLCHK